MAKDRSKTPEDGAGARSKKLRRSASHSETDYSSESDDKPRRRHRRSKTKGKRKSRDDEDDSYTSSSSESDYSSDSGSDAGSDAEAGSSEEDRRRRKRRRKEEERRRKDKEWERKRKRRREREERENRKRRKKKEEKKKKQKKDKDKGKLGAVTNSWGKYGIIRETDMWNKRPEFTAWLLEVKKVNLESLPNYEEKQMFKQFMEDHNTATFTSKKYYNLDAYHQRKMEKEMKRGAKHVQVTERTIFDDEEQRRQEMMQVRERQKQAEVKSLMQAMQSGMAQAMKEQAQLKEEMAYQYKIGNFEAAAAIQRRLEPDPPA